MIFFPGASLDGIYEGKVVEVKCPYVLSEEHPENGFHIHPNHFDKVSHSQLWKVEDNMLKNKDDLWKSVDLWHFKPNDDDLMYIENTSKTKVLKITENNQVILDDFEEDKAEQLWKKGEPDSEGYFLLESAVGSVTVPKVITAISEGGLEIKHLKHLNKKQLKNFFLERTADGATLKTTHKYYYQVQAQMEITGFPETLFVV